MKNLKVFSNSIWLFEDHSIPPRVFLMEKELIKFYSLSKQVPQVVNKAYMTKLS